MFINKKNNSYDSILVIINWLIKIIHYQLIKFTTNATSLTKAIRNVLV